MKQENKHFLDLQDFGLLGVIRYRGCLVYKQENGLYSLWGEKDLLPEGVDSLIDKSNQIIGKSIVK